MVHAQEATAKQQKYNSTPHYSAMIYMKKMMYMIWC